MKVELQYKWTLARVQGLHLVGARAGAGGGGGSNGVRSDIKIIIKSILSRPKSGIFDNI